MFLLRSIYTKVSITRVGSGRCLGTTGSVNENAKDGNSINVGKEKPRLARRTLSENTNQISPRLQHRGVNLAMPAGNCAGKGSQSWERHDDVL
jgi:hypothetical protein